MDELALIGVLATACRALTGLEERAGYKEIARDARLAVSLVMLRLRIDEDNGPAYRYAGPAGVIEG